jgi:hypothetical protein
MMAVALLLLLLLLRCPCPAEKRLAKGEQPQEAEMRSKLNSMRNDRLAAVAQQQAHERSLPVSAFFLRSWHHSLQPLACSVPHSSSSRHTSAACQ